MIKRKDLTKMFCIYLSLIHICPAHLCGEDPLSKYEKLAIEVGKPVGAVLGLVRNLDTNTYNSLMADRQTWARCVGMVDTGYFKRSMETENTVKRNSLTSRLIRFGKLPRRDTAPDIVKQLENSYYPNEELIGSPSWDFEDDLHSRKAKILSILMSVIQRR